MKKIFVVFIAILAVIILYLFYAYNQNKKYREFEKQVLQKYGRYSHEMEIPTQEAINNLIYKAKNDGIVGSPDRFTDFDEEMHMIVAVCNEDYCPDVQVKYSNQSGKPIISTPAETTYVKIKGDLTQRKSSFTMDMVVTDVEPVELPMQGNVICLDFANKNVTEEMNPTSSVIPARYSYDRKFAEYIIGDASHEFSYLCILDIENSKVTNFIKREVTGLDPY